jgi:biopolymer transport protein ExbB
MLRIFLGVFQEGGWVLWPIFAVSTVGWFIGLEKLIYFRKIKRARAAFSKAILLPHSGAQKVKRLTGMSSYDALLLELQKSKDQDARSSSLLFREFLADVIPDLEQGFSTMSACVSVAPLLGLLGTISGMNRMFSIITDVGLGSPSLMAGGISVALGSALAGLAVAVVIMFFHNYLYNKKSKCVKTLMMDGEKIVSGAFVSVAAP